MRISLGALRNVVGLLLGVGFGLILTSPTVSALSMIPGLSLFAPTHNSNVSGAITFFAAADGEGLVSLQFKVDGADYGSPITAGSCRASFDTRSTGDGPHTIQAVGQDEFGNTVFTQPSTIFVNNTAPAISNVGVSNVTSSSASINWATAVAADGRVDYGPSMSYGGSAYDTNVNTSHSVTLTGLSAGTTYHFSATSFGQNGILSSSGDFVFTTAGVPPVPTPTPAPTPTPNPNPTPSPTPVVPSPTPTPGGPTPTPTPIGPTPTPTPVPTPIAPLPSPSPTPTATYDGGTRGRTAPTDSTNVGSAVPRTDGTFAPDPSTITGQATTRGAAAKATVAPSTTAVTRGTGASVSNTVVVNPGTGSGGGQSLSYAMFMPGASTGMSNTQQRSTLPQNQTQTQTQTRGSKTSTDTQPAYKPCVGPNPFANEPDGAKCIDGTWIRNEPDATTTATATTTAATTDPATTTATAGTSVSSVVSAPSVSGSSSATSAGSVSPLRNSGSSSATSGSEAPVASGVKIKPSACSTPDPYAAKGGVGICTNGEWVLLWMPKKGK